MGGKSSLLSQFGVRWEQPPAYQNILSAVPAGHEAVGPVMVHVDDGRGIRCPRPRPSFRGRRTENYEDPLPGSTAVRADNGAAPNQVTHALGVFLARTAAGLRLRRVKILIRLS